MYQNRLADVENNLINSAEEAKAMSIRADATEGGELELGEQENE
jgi:hypothetical protein